MDTNHKTNVVISNLHKETINYAIMKAIELNFCAEKNPENSIEDIKVIQESLNEFLDRLKQLPFYSVKNEINFCSFKKVTNV